ncbi:hypothetical protein HX744_29425 [Pseudonocardia sp. ICBG1122]|nr:hypothetical protein [Pseudonocardia pini]
MSAGEDPSTGERIVLCESVDIVGDGDRAEKAAHREAEKIRTRLLADADELKVACTKATVGALLERWMRQHEIDATTRMTHESQIRTYIFPNLGNVPLVLFVRDASQRLETLYSRLRRCRALCNGRPFVEKDLTDHADRHLDGRQSRKRRAESVKVRTAALGRDAATEPLRATATFGDCPAEADQRDEWCAAVGRVASYREMRGHTGDDSDVLGPAPKPGQVEEFAAYRAAWRTLGRPEIDREHLELSNGRLRARVRAYERELAAAPRYVANELAGTRQTAATHQQTAALRRAEADAITDPAQPQRILAEATQAAALAAVLDTPTRPRGRRPRPRRRRDDRSPRPCRPGSGRDPLPRRRRRPRPLAPRRPGSRGRDRGRAGRRVQQRLVAGEDQSVSAWRGTSRGGGPSPRQAHHNVARIPSRHPGRSATRSG